MVRLKRIKNKEDLLEVLAYIYEDVCTYKFLSNTTDVANAIAKTREMIGGD